MWLINIFKINVMLQPLLVHRAMTLHRNKPLLHTISYTCFEIVVQGHYHCTENDFSTMAGQIKNTPYIIIDTTANFVLFDL